MIYHIYNEIIFPVIGLSYSPLRYSFINFSTMWGLLPPHYFSKKLYISHSYQLHNIFAVFDGSWVYIYRERKMDIFFMINDTCIFFTMHFFPSTPNIPEREKERINYLQVRSFVVSKPLFVRRGIPTQSHAKGGGRTPSHESAHVQVAELPATQLSVCNN